MKRVSWGILLCEALILALFASPGWAAGTFAQLQTLLQNGDTITLNQDYEYTSSSSATEPISFDISKKITIIGNGHTIDGKNTAGPIFHFKSGSGGSSVSKVTFKNAKVTPSNNNEGGSAIYIDGIAITVDSCTFTDNRAGNANTSGGKAYCGGAAIYTKNSVGTIIKDCTFKNNAFLGHTGNNNESGGGAIYNYSDSASTKPSVTITGCTFDGNGETAANITSDTTKHYNSSGGAMTNAIGADNATLSVTIDGCTFNANETSRYGGAIYNITDEKKGTLTVNIKNSTFTNNKLANYANNGSFGGAVGSFAATGTINLTVESSLFKSNTVTNTAAASEDQYIGTRGGAIGNWTIYKNSGGTMNTTITGCRFEGNEANQGGAIVNWGNSGTANLTSLKDCTFIGNKAVTSAIFKPDYTANSKTYQRYPYGSAVFTVGNANGSSSTIPGSAATNIINCTFTGNSSYSGGAVCNYAVAATDKSITTIYNSTFVNNTADNGGTDFHNTGTSTATITNTIFYNSTSGKYSVVNAATAGTVTLTNCSHNNAVVGTGVTVGATNKANVTPVNVANPTNVKINNVEHRVFKLASEDVNLVRGGTATGAPAKDVLGVLRSTTSPSIGAVEYVTLAVSMDKALPDGTVGVLYKQPLEAVFAPVQSGAVLAWSLNSGSTLPDGLTLSIGVISGEPTKVGDYSFTITAKGSDDIYAAYSASQAFTLKINAAPVVSLDFGTVTIKSEGGTDNLDIALTSTDYAAATETSADLTNIKTGALNVASSDQANVLITIETSSADIDVMLCDNADITSSLTKGTANYTLKPATAGTYKIIFKGKDDKGVTKYFAAGFTYAIKDDSGLKVITDPQEATADSDGIIDAAQQILNGYMNGTAPDTEAILDFFENVSYHQEPIYGAEALASLDIPSLEGLQGEKDFGNAENGFKIVAMPLPKGVTLTAGLKFFVIMLDDNVTPAVYRVGIAAVPASDAGASHLVIKFRNLKNTQNTTYYLEYPNGTYDIGATNENGLNSTSAQASAAYIFMEAANGQSFAMALRDPIKLRGQTSSGRDVTAPAKTEDEDSSSSGGSGGCDTGLSGMTLLALAALAIAGKVKK